MKKMLRLLFALALVCGRGAAHADTYITYDVSGDIKIFPAQGLSPGTITPFTAEIIYDQTTGFFTGGSAEMQGVPDLTFLISNQMDGVTTDTLNDDPMTRDEGRLTIEISTSLLASGATSGEICDRNIVVNCPDENTEFDSNLEEGFATDGTFGPASTPEPSS